jgi:lipoyl synthase
MKTVRCYFPGPRFPSVSVTGSRCDLDCPHCMGRPLSAMLPAETPEALKSLAGKLNADDAIGLLLSGGCGADGVVPLEQFSDVIRSIKDTTSLKINAHIGYPRRGTVDRLVKAGVDTFSLTFPMSDEIGKRYLCLDDALSRYDETVEDLLSLGARVIPHALIGLGDQDEDEAGLSTLSSYDPKSLVVIVFTPLKGTPQSTARAPSDKRIIETLASARDTMRRTSIVLGCMRPRGRTELEVRLFEDLVDGIVMPSTAALKAVASTVSLERFEGCCALYL